MPEPVEKLSGKFVAEIVEKVRSCDAEAIQSALDIILDPKTGKFNGALADAVSGALSGELANGNLRELAPPPLREELNEQVVDILLRCPKGLAALKAEIAGGNTDILYDALLMLSPEHKQLDQGERPQVSPEVIAEFQKLASEALTRPFKR